MRIFEPFEGNYGQLVQDPSGKWIWLKGDGEQIEFDSQGRIQVSSMDGEKWKYLYSPNGLLMQLKNSKGASISLRSFHHRIDSLNWFDHKIEFKYDSENLLQVSSQDLNFETYSYDRFNNLTQIRPVGPSGIESLTYDDYDRVIGARLKNKCSHKFQYSKNQNQDLKVLSEKFCLGRTNQKMAFNFSFSEKNQAHRTLQSLRIEVAEKKRNLYFDSQTGKAFNLTAEKE
ncbi:MAG: hypothetical protein KDD22_07420 [Bdellovibrionales bacterium]|nr:hypothetical protein [Bdellovibrionales bacterium]